jgi:hypothetical protein
MEVMKELEVGNEIQTNQGYWVRIVEKVNYNNYTVRFDNGFELSVIKKTLLNGNFSYPFHPTVFGVGYLGVGKYSTTAANVKKDTRLHPAYSVWQGMLGRCYCPKVQIKQPNILNSTVHPYWHNYQNFAKWYEENYIEGFHFCRTIFVPNCNVYSEETCCFVPNEIKNTFIYTKRKVNDLPMGVMPYGTNKFICSINREGKSKKLGIFDTPEEAFKAYKEAKEHYLKYLARKWKRKLPKFPQKTYDALMNYQFEQMY